MGLKDDLISRAVQKVKNFASGIGQTRLPSGITLSQLPQAYLSSFGQAQTMPEKLMNIGTASFLKTSTLGLIQPQAPKAETLPEKFMAGLGGATGIFSPVSPAGKLVRGLEGVGHKTVTKILPKTAPILLQKVLPGIGAEISQGVGYAGLGTAAGIAGLRPGYDIKKELPTDIAFGLAMRGVGAGLGKTINFRLPKNTMDELVTAEDMINNPKNYIKVINAHSAKNRRVLTKKAADEIQRRGAEIVDRLAAKYLPNDVLQKTAANPKAQIKALIDLGNQNRLTNVNYFAGEEGVTGKIKVKTKSAVQTSMAQAEAQAKQLAGQPPSLSDSQLGRPKGLAPLSGAGDIPGKTSQVSVPRGKYAGSVNLNKLKLKPEEKKVLVTVSKVAKKELQKAKGRVLSNKEVVNAARESQVLQGVVTREQTLQAEAALLRARQQVVSLDKEVTRLAKGGNTPLLQKKMAELLESLKTVNANAADRGRQLQALSIEAGDESVRMKLLKDISRVEGDSAKILREAANVDWENSNKVAEFYRKFIKPTTMEVLDEYRYNNMLSNPRTHARNAFLDLVQAFVTRPATLAAQGKFGETGQYYKGAIKALPDATNDFIKAFKGETAIGQQDIKNIPTGKIPKFLTIPSRALEASDRFFTKLISSGELARGATAKQAEEVAAYSLFRQGLRPKGQGALLNAIDSFTEWTYKAPKAVRWFVPFIRTPMNFAKQWIEYSPLGIATLPGAANKKEQLAKTIIGSTVAAIGAKFALDNNTTWSAPTDPKEKELFYASGRKPFSVKIGDKWVSMMYAGPFAQALALPAAIKYYVEDSRTALTDNQLDKLGKITMSMAEYLSGQTFLDGLNNFVRFFSGDTDYTFAKNLGYTAGQVIPAQGLVRWVNTILDPVYRKTKTFGGQIKSGLPGMSQGLEPYLTPEGEPSVREPINIITPYDISTNKPQYELALKQRQQKLQQNAVINQAKKEAEKGVSSIVGKVIVYTNENGNAVTIDLTKYDDINKLPATNKYEAAVKESKQYTEASKIIDNNSLTDEQKQIALQRLGVDQADAAYYAVANDNTSLKTLFVLDAVSKIETPDQLANLLVEFRKQVNGQMIASNAVLDNLVDEGLITKEQAKDLKKYKTEQGKLTPIKKSSLGKVKVKKPPKITVKRLSAPKVKLKKTVIKTIKPKTYKPARFTPPKPLKVKKITTKKIKLR